MPVFEAEKFTIDTRWWLNLLWCGGGHTFETDPAKRGWRALPLTKGDNTFVLIGRKGVPGCFSARLMGDGRVDVVTYDDRTPQQVAAGDRVADCIRLVPGIPGWALPFIRELENS